MITRHPYPTIDGRRVRELRRALLRDAAAMAPHWRGAAEESGADRALVEAAARLFEEATTRLNKTPERDALAFLDAFDVAPPEPVAAQGHIALALKGDKADPVEIAARTGLEIAARIGVGEEAEDGKAAFETIDPLRIQPGHIEMVASVDPSTDRIEIAPDSVTTLEPDLAPRPHYSLQTGAPGESNVVAIEPPVGLAPGDLLKVTLNDGTVRYLEIAEVAEDGRITLTGPVGGAGLTRDAVESIERQTSLDLFAMPDVQEHGFYIGDKDALNVQEPAEFTLRFDPPSVGAALIAARVRFEIFGTPEPDTDDDGDPVAAWQTLVPLAGPGTDIVLSKAWTGSVDELKLKEEDEEAWRLIRIAPPGRISNQDLRVLIAATADLRKVTIGVKTVLPKGESDDTISHVAHNGLPLSTAGPFLAFGPEPQRFDAFSLAAPEVFSKANATATLDFRMADGTMLAITQALRVDGERHVYGVSRNGRLQILDLAAEPAFREADGPIVEHDGTAAARLDPGGGVLAAGATTLKNKKCDDMVIARAANGGWHAALVRFDRNQDVDSDLRVNAEGWTPLPALDPEAIGADSQGIAEIPALAIVPNRQGTDAYFADIIAATSQGFYRLRLLSDAQPNANEWTHMDVFADAPGFRARQSPVLVRVEDVDFAGDTVQSAWDRRGFLTVDRNDTVWLLAIGINRPASRLTDLQLPIGSGAKPAGVYYSGGANLAVAVVNEPDLVCLEFDYPNLTGQPAILRFISFGPNNVGSPLETIPPVPNNADIMFLPGLSDNSLPHLLGYASQTGGPRLFEWRPRELEDGFVETSIPGGIRADDNTRHPLIAGFVPRAGSNDHTAARPMVIASGESISALVLELNQTIAADRFDWIEIPGANTNHPTTPVIRFEEAGDTEVMFDPILVGERGAGTPVTILPDSLDRNADVIAFRTEAHTDFEDAVLDEPNKLTNLGGHGLTDTDTVLVARKSAPDVFRIFQVVEPIGADSVELAAIDGAVVPFDQDFQTLFDANDRDVIWRKLDEARRIRAGEGTEFQSTLIDFGTGNAIPNAVGPFENPSVLVPVETLANPSNGAWGILTGSPANHPTELFFKSAASVDSMERLVETPIAEGYSAPKLSWEYFDGEGWKRLPGTVSDATGNLARSGEITFTVPRDLSIVEIGGQEDFWIRARLIGGDYGRPRYVVKTNDTEQTISVKTSHMRPPEVARLSAAVDLEPEHRPQALIARNNRTDINVTGANGLRGARITMFRGVFDDPLTPRDEPGGPPTGRALLIGFSRPLVTGPATLLVKAQDRPPGDAVRIAVLGADNQWTEAPLTSLDPTLGLTRSGLISFQVPIEPAQVRLLGESLHWIRVSVPAGTAATPNIERAWLNGVAVLQATTHEQELIGSSTGEPGQSFQLLNAPMLPDSLELRVRERLGQEDIDQIRREGEADDVLTDVPNIPGIWVKWTRVDTFIGQSAGERVYLADAGGTIRFGEGTKQPIAGADNLRAFSYASGGSRIETQAFAEASVTASVEALEVVLAPIAIAGGRDMPGRAELVQRMPDVLRHAGAGLSLRDIENLARDRDNEIVQVRAFAPAAPSDPVRLVVLGRGESRAPVYSRASRDALRSALNAVMSDAYGSECLSVETVAFAPLVVTVRLIAKPGRAAELDARANTVLQTFLHPAKGFYPATIVASAAGDDLWPVPDPYPGGQGWPPGRGLWPTDIRRVLAALPDLDRIEQIDIADADNRPAGPAQSNQVITTASSRDIRIETVEATS